jgi:hypothetical protein
MIGRVSEYRSGKGGVERGSEIGIRMRRIGDRRGRVGVWKGEERGDRNRRRRVGE